MNTILHLFRSLYFCRLHLIIPLATLALAVQHLEICCSQDTLSRIPTLGQPITDEQAAELAALAIAGLDREFPNKPANVITGPDTILGPRQLHPAFFGCFDWHSSVHGHWVLIRLLKTNSNHRLAVDSRKRLNDHLTLAFMQSEADYFKEKENKSFERMYGWAWLLRLVTELHEWDDVSAILWRENIRPLESKIVELVFDYLPRLSKPIRTGVHPDTAFALSQILDYARSIGNEELEQLVVGRARDFFESDVDYNEAFEPSGEDFFSQSLNEADLMRRILSPSEFADWLSRFLPQLADSNKSALLQPVEVTDVTDGKLVHLAGLDLSRAWTLDQISSSLPSGDSRRRLLSSSAAEHAATGLGYVFSGHYEGEHWLGTFAVYALTRVGGTK